MQNSYGSLFSTFVICVVGILFCFVTSYVYAEDNGVDTIVKTLCFVTDSLNGPIGKTISVLIVMTVAISLFLGKITWGVAITIAIGMGLLFGSTQIVMLVSGDKTDPCANGS